jgi:hexosaminidase
MKKGLMAIGMLIGCFIGADAQSQTKGTSGMDLKYEVLGAGYNNTDKALSVLTITNTNKSAFPSAGWSIYFNCGGLKVAAEDSSRAEVIHVNGDLFKLVPKKAASAKGPAGRFQLIASLPNNVSDLPGGFYLVWDKEPEKGLTFGKMDISSAVDRSKSEALVANRTYDENKLVTDIPLERLPAIFPTPSRYQKSSGTFTIKGTLKITAAPTFLAEARQLAKAVSLGLPKPVSVNGAGNGPEIVFEQVAGLPAEGYQLNIAPNKIRIRASDAAGAFYAVQSIRSMLPTEASGKNTKAIQIPAADIEDHPRFGFRAFMLEVGRNFQPKSEALKVLDLMALYKLNVLHLHLNDDEGWRLEIPGLPELTEVGSKRGHTTNDSKNLVPSYGSGPMTNVNSGSGFYSRADYIEILKYAKQLHIKVIPEIETPGHARAAIKSMDARYQRFIQAGDTAKAKEYLLRDLADKSIYRSVQGWSDNVVNVGLPSTYRFMEKVVDELISMYKDAGADLETIHFGGDEVPAGVWTQSEAAKAVLSSHPELQGTDDLWAYYFAKVNALLKARKLYLTGWEEIALHKAMVDGTKKMVVNPAFTAENFHADVWNNTEGNEDLAYKLANAGYKVTLTNVSNLYFDLAANKGFEEPGQYWGGYVDVDKPFYFVPYDYYKTSKEDSRGEPVDQKIFKDKVRLTAVGKSNIIGLQAPLWSETIHTPERLEYMLLPKLLALAERAWAKDPEWATTTDTAAASGLYKQSWSEFINVLGKKELPRLDHFAGGFKYRIPAPGVTIADGQISANVLYPGLTIRYTTNGAPVTQSSTLYKGPFVTKGTIKLAAFNSAGRSGTTVSINK